MTIKKIAKKILPRPLQTIIQQILKLSATNVSSHKIIKNPDLNSLRKKYNNIWKDNSIPYKQVELVRKQLVDFTKVAPMRAIVDLMKKIKIKNPSVLEIGCSTGHYSEVFKKAGLKVEYEGCDYSPTFIKLAKKTYPKIKFKATDACKLDYKNKQFDIVISGCCILHIIDYKKAIAEAARVAKNFVIFHRTPVIHLNKTVFTKKIGYNIEMIEILFNEKELKDLFYKNDLIVQNINSYANFSIKGLSEPVYMKSYLCKKV